MPKERRPQVSLQAEVTPLMGTDLRLELPCSATPDGVGELVIAATLYAPAEVDQQDVGVSAGPAGPTGGTTGTSTFRAATATASPST